MYNENFVKKDEIFVKQTGNKWSFTRKAFIKKFIGFVFTTDDDGVITDVELSFDIVK